MAGTFIDAPDERGYIGDYVWLDSDWSGTPEDDVLDLNGNEAEKDADGNVLEVQEVRFSEQKVNVTVPIYMVKTLDLKPDFKESPGSRLSNVKWDLQPKTITVTGDPLSLETIDEINLAMIAVMKQQAGIHSAIVSEVIDAVAEAIRAEEDLEIYTSGTNNIFRYPELADQQKASELINTFEEKQLLGELLQEAHGEGEETGIQVYIGAETQVQSMKDCSVVTATYELEEGMKGTIGIIGPRRMDYDKVISTLKTLKCQLDTIYKKDNRDSGQEKPG